MTLTVSPDVGDAIDLNAAQLRVTAGTVVRRMIMTAISDGQEVDLTPPKQRQGRPRSVAVRLLPSEVERLAGYATSREINMRLAARALVAAKADTDRSMPRAS